MRAITSRVTIPAILPADPRGSPKHLGTASFVTSVGEERIVAQKLDHQLNSVSSRSPDTRSDIDELFPDLSSHVHIRNIRQIDKYRKIPLEVGYVLVCSLRTQGQDTLC